MEEHQEGGKQRKVQQASGRQVTGRVVWGSEEKENGSVVRAKGKAVDWDLENWAKVFGYWNGHL